MEIHKWPFNIGRFIYKNILPSIKQKPQVKVIKNVQNILPKTNNCVISLILDTFRD